MECCHGYVYREKSWHLSVIINLSSAVSEWPLKVGIFASTKFRSKELYVFRWHHGKSMSHHQWFCTEMQTKKRLFDVRRGA